MSLRTLDLVTRCGHFRMSRVDTACSRPGNDPRYEPLGNGTSPSDKCHGRNGVGQAAHRPISLSISPGSRLDAVPHRNGPSRRPSLRDESEPVVTSHLPRRRLIAGWDEHPLGVGCHPIGGLTINQGHAAGWGPVADDNAVDALLSTHAKGGNCLRHLRRLRSRPLSETAGPDSCPSARKEVRITCSIGAFRGIGPHASQPAQPGGAKPGEPGRGVPRPTHLEPHRLRTARLLPGGRVPRRPILFRPAARVRHQPRKSLIGCRPTRVHSNV